MFQPGHTYIINSATSAIVACCPNIDASSRRVVATGHRIPFVRELCQQKNIRIFHAKARTGMEKLPNPPETCICTAPTTTTQAAHVILAYQKPTRHKKNTNVTQSLQKRRTSNTQTYTRLRMPVDRKIFDQDYWL